MRATSSFEYCLVRVVPRVERGERINAGVILYCRAREFLAAAIELDEQRLLALDPHIDTDEVRAHLEALCRVCAGDPAAGPIARLPDQSERFRWLVAPRSAVLQCSEVHLGLCEDPAIALARLVEKVVRRPIDPA